MLGMMQSRPLLISSLLDYAASWHGQREIVSRDVEGSLHRTNWSGIADRAKRVASVLDSLGVTSGERVATLAWNGYRHLELYFGVSSSQRVLHTVNPRLFSEQIRYIIHHGENAYVFFDPVFASLVEQLASNLPLVRGWVAMCDRAGMPIVKVENLLCYEDLLSAASPDYIWPVFDENHAASLCYTSGTTGNPKGVRIATDLRSSTHSPPARAIAGVHRSRFNLSRSAAVPCKCLGRPVRCCHVWC